jgi:hypothetical protein
MQILTSLIRLFNTLTLIDEMPLLTRILFSPILTAPLLILLSRNPELAQSALQQYGAVSTATAIPVVKNLKLFLTVNLVYRAIGFVNGILNRWAENNWIWSNSTTVPNWNEEIAVVTGGSHGIGAHVAKGLADKGVRVAVLDKVDLSDEVSGCKWFISCVQCVASL